MTDLALILPELILTAGALLVLLGEALMPRRVRLAQGITILTLLLGLFAILLGFGAQGDAFHRMLRITPYERLFDLIFVLGALLVVFIAVDYFTDGLSEFYFLVLAATVGMMLLAKSTDLVMVFLSLELISFPLFVLAGILRGRPRSLEAAAKFFVLGAFSSSFLLFGLVLILAGFGTTNVDDLTRILLAPGTSLTPLLITAVLLIGFGLAFKVAAVPFHFWTPDVFEGAPMPVVAFLSGGPKAAGFAAIVRFLNFGLAGVRGFWLPLVMGIAILSMFLGNLTALRQESLKRMLAYSTIAHVGYLLVGVLADNTMAYASIPFYLLVYTLMSTGAFAVLALVGDENATFEGIRGLASKNPGVALAMTLFMASLAGVPVTGGFVGKFYLFSAAVKAGLTSMAVLGLINSVISAYYYLKVVLFMYSPRPPETPELPRTAFIAVALWICGLFVLYLGIYPDSFLILAQSAF